MLEKFDCVNVTTTGSSQKGTFVKLENGESGWIYKTFLPKGVNAICTVLYVKKDGFVILSLDSVKYQAA